MSWFGGAGKAVRIATLVVVLATVAAEAVAVLAYRHSTDGQTSILWLLIVVYGALAIGVVRLLDRLLRRPR